MRHANFKNYLAVLQSTLPLTAGRHILNETRSSSVNENAVDLNRNISLDILKIVMAYMVVGLHADFLGDISSVARYLTVNGLFRIAVPVFFVINGFFFYSALQTSPFKWFKRALVLYGFWTLVYIYFWLRPDEFTLIKSIKITIVTVLVGHNHLWYLPAMIGAAAVLYLLRNCSTRLLFFLALVLFFIGLSIEYIGGYHLVQNATIDRLCGKLWLYRSFLFFAFPFFCIGYLLKRTGLYAKTPKTPLVLLTLLGLALLLAESYFNFTTQSTVKRFDIFASLIILCPALFLLALTTDVRGKSKSIALYSTAIYFVHPLFISLFENFSLRETPLTIVVSIAATLAAAVLIKANSRIRIML